MRDHGVNEKSYFFGRSEPVARQVAEDLGLENDGEQQFVYTSTTLRLMEQICVSL